MFLFRLYGPIRVCVVARNEKKKEKKKMMMLLCLRFEQVAENFYVSMMFIQCSSFLWFFWILILEFGKRKGIRVFWCAAAAESVRLFLTRFLSPLHGVINGPFILQEIRVWDWYVELAKMPLDWTTKTCGHKIKIKKRTIKTKQKE